MKITTDRLRKIINEEVTTLVNEAGGLAPITVGEVRQWKDKNAHMVARNYMHFKVVGPEDWSHTAGARFGGQISTAGSILGVKTGDVIPDSTSSVVIKPVMVRGSVVTELPEAPQVTVPVKIVRLNSSILSGVSAGSRAASVDAGGEEVEAPPLVDKKQEKQNVAKAIARFISDQSADGKTEKEIIDMLMDPSSEFKLSKYLAKTHISKQGGMMENSLRTLRRVIREEVARSNENYKFENHFGFAAGDAGDAGVVNSIVDGLEVDAKEEHMRKPFESMNELIGWIYANTPAPYDVTRSQYKAAAERIWEFGKF